MNKYNKITKTFNNVKKRIIKTYDVTKLELKIKDYKREEEKICKLIGEIVYNNYKQNINTIDKLTKKYCEDIITIRSRVSLLKNRISDKKSLEKPEKILEVTDELENTHDIQEIAYLEKLNKRSNDLTIGRTNNEITILKSCQHCQHSNPLNYEECLNCGLKF